MNERTFTDGTPARAIFSFEGRLNIVELDTIVQADALTFLRTLPDKSVNLVVTSPPYFGLRDYGTAEWEGGDSACDHAIGRFTTPASDKQMSNAAPGVAQARAVCPKCGARRIDQQIGLEATPAAYIARMVDVFAEVRRVLRDDGNVYVNLGDSYASKPVGRFNGGGFKDGSIGRDLSGVETSGKMDKVAASGLPGKSLIGVPWRFAIAMQDDGWLLREDIVWQKPNPMPESVRDRCTRSHEYIFHFTKQPRYWYDAQAVAEPNAINPNWNYGSENYRTRAQEREDKFTQYKKGEKGWHGFAAAGPNGNGRNRRSVWTINPANFKSAHFATFPEDIPELCIKAACPEGGVVLDPFTGAGTVALVAKRLNRRYLGCDLNAAYVEMARARVDSIPYTLFSLMNVGD